MRVRLQFPDTVSPGVCLHAGKLHERHVSPHALGGIHVGNGEHHVAPILIQHIEINDRVLPVVSRVLVQPQGAEHFPGFHVVAENDIGVRAGSQGNAFLQEQRAIGVVISQAIPFQIIGVVPLHHRLAQGIGQRKPADDILVLPLQSFYGRRYRQGRIVRPIHHGRNGCGAIRFRGVLPESNGKLPHPGTVRSRFRFFIRAAVQRLHGFPGSGRASGVPEIPDQPYAADEQQTKRSGAKHRQPDVRFPPFSPPAQTQPDPHPFFSLSRQILVSCLW